ncbi:hypothetical protein GBA52_026390 [Prunus armeniaca]|nr:hypothetical protein GBA52_026390 [Prunus armeniaca]
MRTFVKNVGNCLHCHVELYNDRFEEVVGHPCNHQFHKIYIEKSDNVPCPLCEDTHMNIKKQKKYKT